MRIRAMHLLLLLIPTLLWAGNPRAAARKGVELYQQGEYDKALAEFLAAKEDSPERMEIPYDIGAALYKLENYPNALGAFAKALSRDNPRIAADAWYNLGNALVKNGKLKEAVDAYKHALRIRHDDLDAKHNLETVLKMLEMQQQQQRQQSQQSDSTAQAQQQPQTQQPDSTEQQQQEAQMQNPQPSEASPAEQDSTDRAQSERQTEMTPEEALQLLQALENDEQEAQKEKLKRQFGRPKRVEKDW